MFPFNKTSYKDKQQASFFFKLYIYINIYTEIPKQRLRRKYKNPQGIVIKHFVFLILSIAENNGKDIIYFLLIEKRDLSHGSFNRLFSSKKIFFFWITIEPSNQVLCIHTAPNKTFSIHV